jgi:transcriptional regulator GlxA family with amidase domain
MQRVFIVVFGGVQTLDATGPAEVFAAARRHGEPVYRVDFGSLGGGEIVTSSSLRILTRDLARVRLRPDDTIVVAGAAEEDILREVADGSLAAWLARVARTGCRMASVCSGAFLLAEAGILDGKRAATHWLGCEQLAQLYPRVEVDPNAIFVQDGGVWTSAGVTTGIDMALSMVEHDLDRAAADAIAALLVLYVRRPGYQSQFSQALIAQTSGSDPLGPALAWARANLAKADIEGLARRAGLSVRTLHRRCVEQLGTTPAKLIDKLRIEHARTLLATSELPAKTLAEQCGFGNATRMHRAFQRELGMGPRDYRILHAGNPEARSG